MPAETAAESDLLLQARRLTLTALERVKSATMIDDVCVPRSRLAEMLDGTAAIAEKYGLTIGVCAHAGDGNTHPTVCFDAADPDESRRARESFDDIMALGLQLGGTITGEHGVGVLKKEWLARELGPVGAGVAARHQGRLRPAGHSQPRQAVLKHPGPGARSLPHGRAGTARRILLVVASTCRKGNSRRGSDVFRRGSERGSGVARAGLSAYPEHEYLRPSVLQ